MIIQQLYNTTNEDMKKSSVVTDYIIVMTVGIGTMCGVEVCTIAPKL